MRGESWERSGLKNRGVANAGRGWTKNEQMQALALAQHYGIHDPRQAVQNINF